VEQFWIALIGKWKSGKIYLEKTFHLLSSPFHLGLWDIYPNLSSAWVPDI
jgi:hypothetical protein